jgi:hypothetical protein
VNSQLDHFEQNTFLFYERNIFYWMKVGLDTGQFGHLFALRNNDSSKEKIMFGSMVTRKVLFA